MDISALLEWASGLGERARRDEPLAPYTAMRVGGPADLLVICRTTEEVVEAVQRAHAAGVPWRVLGGGCNVLVSDAGVRGLVVVNRADRTRIGADGTVWAEAGAPMAALARETVARGLAGLEWAAGLPGTVGGAVVGNAGAFGGDVASVLRSVTLLEPDGNVTERPAAWMEFAYRESRIKRTPSGERPVVLAATFCLSPGDPSALAARVEEILAWRRTRHPSGATMGSTFKNPPGNHAGRLIEAAGLKGYRIGGAMVSELHANFLINTGSATAADVRALIQYIQAEVERQFGIRLEPEVEFIGWDAEEEIPRRHQDAKYHC
ncbi:MAG: UDP-N-acetylmuramate dehydrogenase [Anaerolineae bacterium]|nr:UDP-N-acetylmuramate dehydrogenase [Anaerolineae bacterium]